MILIKIDSNSINLGNMDGLLFNIKYIISFIFQSDLNEFKDNYFFKKSINHYLTQFNCNEESNEIQIMKNKYGKIIGISLKPDLNSLKINQKTNYISSYYFTKRYKNQNYYSPDSKIYNNRYRNEQNFE